MSDTPSDPPPDRAPAQGQHGRRPPPAGFVVVGVLSIIVGSSGALCCGGLGLVGMLAMQFGGVTMAMETGLVDYVVPVLYLAFSVMLIVAGVGLFTMASWTRRVAVWACSGILLTLSINILFGSWGRPQDVFEAIGAVISVLVTLFWPLFILIFMNLDSVRRQVEGPVAGEQDFFGAPPAGGPRGQGPSPG